jgi:hypothetical protein
MSFVSIYTQIATGLPIDRGLSMEDLIKELDGKAPISGTSAIEQDPFPSQLSSQPITDQDIVFVDIIKDGSDDE